MSSSGQEYLGQYYSDATEAKSAKSVAVEEESTATAIDATLSTAGRITGVVTGATGSPLAEVGVCADGTAGGDCATTNGLGEYTIAGLAEGSYTVSFEAPYELHYALQYFDGKSSAEQATPVKVLDGEPTTAIDAKLEHLGQITGLVTRAGTSTPVEGIEACATLVPNYYGGLCAETTSSGEYAIEGLAPGEYTVEFYSPTSNYVAQYYPAKALRSEALSVSASNGTITPKVDAAMVATGEIGGTITAAASGAPLEGADACAYTSAGQYERCTSTNAQGKYVISDLAPGEYKVDFDSYRGEFFSQFYDGQTSLQNATPVSVTSGEETPGIDARLLGGVITGKVTSAASSEGAGKIDVCARTDSYYGGCALTNAAGEYRIVGLTSGKYIVSFETSGADAAGQNLLEQFYDGAALEGEATELSVSDEAVTSEIDATLKTGAAIAGQVTDSLTHEPISGVEVCPLSSTNEYVGHCAHANSQGEYNITGLPTGEYFLQYQRTGWVLTYWQGVASRAEAKPVSATAGLIREHVDETMAPLGIITGQVDDGVSHEPVDGARACAELYGYYRQCTETNAKGEYTLSALETGQYELVFTDYQDGYLEQYYKNSATEGEASEVNVEPATTDSNIDAALVRAGTISGAVTGSDTGKAVAGIYVCAKVKGAEFSDYCDTTNNAGEYVLSGMSAGEYLVEFSTAGADRRGKANYLSQFYEAASTETSARAVVLEAGAAAEHIDATLSPGAEIAGTVTGAPSQTPLANVQVCLLDSTGSTLACEETGIHGEYGFAGLAAGSYRLYFAPGSYSDYVAQYYKDSATLEGSTALTVVSGEVRSTVDAELTDFGSVTGRVTGAGSGTAIAGISVCAVSGGFAEARDCSTTNSAGEYSIEGIPAGTYAIRFDSSIVDQGARADYVTGFYGGSLEEAGASDVTVEPGRTAPEIDGVLQTGGEIHGVVTGSPSGEPAGAIEVCPVRSNGSRVADCAETAADGSYTLSGLATGGYVLSFVPAPYGSANGRYQGAYLEGKAQYSEVTPVLVTEGATTNGIDQALLELGTISGRVVSATAPAGVAGVDVCVWLQDGAYGKRCSGTAENGTYSFSGLPSGTYEVQFDPSLDRHARRELPPAVLQGGQRRSHGDARNALLRRGGRRNQCVPRGGLRSQRPGHLRRVWLRAAFHLGLRPHPRRRRPCALR